jgi:hypothetical protein
MLTLPNLLPISLHSDEMASLDLLLAMAATGNKIKASNIKENKKTKERLKKEASCIQ